MYDDNQPYITIFVRTLVRDAMQQQITEDVFNAHSETVLLFWLI